MKTADIPPRRRRAGRLGPIARLLIAVVTAGAVLTGALLLYMAPTLPEARAALVTTGAVAFAETSVGLTFGPRQGGARAGLILYPGAKVPPEAYAPLAATLAASGYLTVIPPVRFGLALFDEAVAGAAIAAHPEVTRWVVGGHSLGGVAAADFVAAHPGAIRGLLMLASFPQSSVDLSGTGMAVTVITASEDPAEAGMLDEAVRRRYPDTARFTRIDGGNHEQFAWYTNQPRDGRATLPRIEQQRLIVDAVLALMRRIE